MKRKYPLPNGQEVDGEEVEFETERENFNVYILGDGTTLKVKNVLTKVVRLDAWGPDGNPIYLIQGGAVTMADSPDHLKRRS